MIHLILGGRRSGKSCFAEQQAAQTGKPVIYIATSDAQDGEMQERVALHRQSRPAEWRTVEEPVALAEVIRQHSDTGNCLLVDCLTIWLTNLLIAEHDITAAKAELLEALAQCEADVVLVTNETGLGVVPMGELTRRYCDEAGWLHQAIAERATRVDLVVAGLPLALKPQNN